MSAPERRRLDLLRWPLLGALLRWRHARTSLQLVLMVTAAAVVLHGLLGPELAPANLATVLTWVHYRGLLVLALLAAGNLFCMGCPFVLVRDVGRRARAPARRWPRVFRTKWIGVALFAAVLFSYELFDLWALPRSTAYLVLAYFAAAFVVDLTFTGATFCKYLCPIGQFNFIASSISPLELQVRDVATCRTCRTADCIKGRRSAEAPRVVSRRGCELGLFLPLKVGNMDCTFCLDCVQACPHDNIALAPRVPGMELTVDRRRSGIGRFAQRPDIAVLALLFTFGALLNAFAMVGPFHRLEHWLAQAAGGWPEAPVLAGLFVVGLGVAPAIVVGGAAAMTRRLVPGEASIGRTAARYTYALVPLGFGVWAAHYGFHLLTGALVVVPVTQSAVIDALGWAALGEPLWHWTGIRAGAVYPIQAGFILLGTMGSLAVAYRISEDEYPSCPGAATAPWAAAAIALAAAALWILAQPMAMRGMIG